MVQSPFRVLLNRRRSYLWALLGVSIAYQLAKYSLVLTVNLQVAFIRSPYRVIRPLVPPLSRISERLLKVRPSAPLW